MRVAAKAETRGVAAHRDELLADLAGVVCQHLSWRLRVRPGPFGVGAGWYVIEQNAFADTSDTIGSLDLLCSGFQPESQT
jgi:hypothetical protein